MHTVIVPSWTRATAVIYLVHSYDCSTAPSINYRGHLLPVSVLHSLFIYVFSSTTYRLSLFLSYHLVADQATILNMSKDKAPPLLSASKTYEDWTNLIDLWKDFTSLDKPKKAPVIILLEVKAQMALEIPEGWSHQRRRHWYPHKKASHNLSKRFHFCQI